jgi:hypothetical protein
VSETLLETWATAADVIGDESACWGDCVELDEYVLDEALWEASEFLNEQTGGRFPGLAEETIRPCARSRAYPSDVLSVDGIPIPGWFDGWGWCGCAASSSGCGCSGASVLDVGLGPIVDVPAVVIDGDALDPTEFDIVDGWQLLRLPSITAPDDRAYWPRSQRLDLPLTEEGTWGVTVRFGDSPPRSGRTAAIVLGCDIAKARCADPTCRLPERTTTLIREGATITIAAAENDIIRTLPATVRRFLATYPKAAESSEVWSPDLRAPHTSRRGDQP